MSKVLGMLAVITQTVCLSLTGASHCTGKAHPDSHLCLLIPRSIRAGSLQQGTRENLKFPDGVFWGCGFGSLKGPGVGRSCLEV